MCAWQFALEEDFDKNALTALLMLLILVTVFYEQGMEWLEASVFSEGIANLLLQKMSRELAILGFVSFTATVIMQFAELGAMEVCLASPECRRSGAPRA